MTYLHISLSTNPPPPYFYTLSLHDALPICAFPVDGSPPSALVSHGVGASSHGFSYLVSCLGSSVKIVRVHFCLEQGAATRHSRSSGEAPQRSSRQKWAEIILRIFETEH